MSPESLIWLPASSAFTLDAAEAGNRPLKAQLGIQEHTQLLAVKGPLLGEGRAEFENTWCSNQFPIHVSFRNHGDGVAKDVHIRITLFDDTGKQVDEVDRWIGNVASGASSMHAIQMTATDRCGEEDWYRASVKVSPKFGLLLQMDAPRFAT